MKILKAIYELFRDAAQAWARDRASRWAAALAYYALFSLAPLVVLFISTIALAIGPDVAALASDQVTQRTAILAGPTAAQAVELILANAIAAREGVAATLISAITLLWGASGVFTALQDALNVIWDAPAPAGRLRRLFKKRLVSFLLVLLFGGLLLASTLLNAVLAALADFIASIGALPETNLQLIDLGLTLVGITVLLAVLFRVLPDAPVAWEDVWLGALVTSLLFGIGRWAITLYVRTTGFGSAYGAASSIVVLLLWVYFTAQSIFYGAELTQVYARRYGSRREAGATAGAVTGKGTAVQRN